MRTSLIITALVGLIVNASVAHANTVTFVTPTGSTVGGQPVNASATFATSANVLSVSLSDLLVNPTDVGQLISDLFFTLSGGQTTGTLASSSGNEITVNSNGSFTLGPGVSTGWGLNQNVSGGLQLSDLGFPIAPTHLIIGPPGPGGFTNANGSIAGNPAHNPFLNDTATFTLDIAGLTTASTVTGATFSFGTTAGSNVVGVPSAVPLPGGFMLFGTVLVGGLGLAGWRKRRQRGPVSIMA